MPMEKPYVPLPLQDYEHPLEFALVMRDALIAHKKNYEAGVVHGNICPQVIMRVPDESKECDVRGILLDLDDPRRSQQKAAPSA